MDLAFAGDHGLSIEAQNYVNGYRGLLKEENILESFEKKINHMFWLILGIQKKYKKYVIYEIEKSMKI